MAKKRFTPEQIIQHLRTVELEQGKGLKLDQAAKKVGVTPQTIARWRNEFGGLIDLPVISKKQQIMFLDSLTGVFFVPQNSPTCYPNTVDPEIQH